MLFVKEAQSHNDRTVASAQEEIRRLAGDGKAPQPEAASSINSGLSIIGKIVGNGALTIFGRVEGEVHASTVVVAEGAEMLGDLTSLGRGLFRANKRRPVQKNLATMKLAGALICGQ